jgi:hypothetical protein
MLPAVESTTNVYGLTDADKAILKEILAKHATNGTEEQVSSLGSEVGNISGNISMGIFDTFLGIFKIDFYRFSTKK